MYSGVLDAAAAEEAVELAEEAAELAEPVVEVKLVDWEVLSWARVQEMLQSRSASFARRWVWVSGAMLRDGGERWWCDQVIRGFLLQNTCVCSFEGVDNSCEEKRGIQYLWVHI